MGWMRGLVAALLFVQGGASAATLTWTGAIDRFMANPANWSPAVTPGPGDTLVFDQTSPQPFPINNTQGLSVARISAPFQAYQLSGYPIAVTAGIDAFTSIEFLMPIDFGANAVAIPRGEVDFTGGIAGTGSIALGAANQSANIVLKSSGAFSGTITQAGAGGRVLLVNVQYPAMGIGPGVGLGGAGTVGNVDGARLSASAGFGSGGIATGNLSLGAAGLQISSVESAPSAYAPLSVVGTVTIAPDATLALNLPPYVPNQQFVLVRNDGTDAVTGHFAGLPEGAILSALAGDFAISYQGGDGNDVVLTALAPARTWVGTAAAGVFSDAASWSPAGVPQAGDRLRFDGNTPTTQLVNDLPAGTMFTGLTVASGASHTFTGNAIGITTYLLDNVGSRFDLPIDLAPGAAATGNAFFPLYVNGPLGGSGPVSLYWVHLASASSTFSGEIDGGVVVLDHASLPGASFRCYELAGTGTVGSVDATLLISSGTLQAGPAAIDWRFVAGLGASSASPLLTTTALAIGPSASLEIGSAPGFAPPPSIVLIRYDGGGAFPGFFPGYPEGAEVNVAGAFYRLTYQGGDGNDLELVALDRLAKRMTSPRHARDFDADGREDLTFARAAGEAGVWTMRGLSVQQANGVAAPAGGIVVAQGDFNGDGMADLLWRTADGSYYMSLMNGVNSAGPQLVANGGSGWEVVGTGDFNGDGRTDLLWRNANGTYALWLMNGPGYLAIATVSPFWASKSVSGYTIDAIGDFDGDGKDDFLWTQPNGSAKTMLMDGTAVRDIVEPLNQFAFSYRRPVVVADLNGDHVADVLWEANDGSLGAWMMARYYIGSGVLLGAGTGWHLRAAGDLDGDGKADIVLQHDDGSAAGWLMDGLNVRGGSAWLGAGNGWMVSGMRDLDGDGHKDILVTHTDGTVAAWLMDGLSIRAGGVLMNGGSTWTLAP